MRPRHPRAALRSEQAGRPAARAAAAAAEPRDPLTVRLGLILVLAFVGIALLAGLVAFLFAGTSARVLHQVEELRQGGIAQVNAATGMRLALESSQQAAQALLAERYRAQVEASHESEWGAARDIDRAAIRDSLQEFARELDSSWQATRTAAALARRYGDSAEAERELNRLSDSLRAIESEFKVYSNQIDRFVHLARYHPSEQVREHVDDVLRPQYRQKMLPLIRAYEDEAKSGLAADAGEIEAALSAGNRRNRALAGVALAGAILLGLVLARWISHPLGRLSEAAHRVGKGDLETPIEVRSGTEIGVLAESFRRMVGDLRESTVSRAFLDKILQSMREMVLVSDADDRLSLVNRVAVEELGYTEDELLGRRFGELVEETGDAVSDAGDGSPPGPVETSLLTADGRRLPVAVSTSVLRDDAGRLEGVVRVAQNVSERRQAETDLRRSLAEKEELLKEVHHRVKNNLQIISSLLNLQEGDAAPADTERRFRESQNRIRSMALIHELLYRSDDLTRIDFAEYLERLVHHVVRSYGGAGQSVRTVLEVDPEPMSLDCAIPCGLIVTELVANAVEHAFPGRQGTVAVRFTAANGRHRLSVADDGVGLPAEVDPATADTLGLRLVAALARQLGGELERTTGEGTELAVTYDPRTAAG